MPSVASSSGNSPKRHAAAEVVIAAAQHNQLMAGTTAAFGSALLISDGTGGGSGALMPISLIFDSLTFDKRQTRWLKDMERNVETEKKRKRKEWEREVERMREEFLRLYPLDRKWGSDELIVDPFVARRRGSTDILDIRRMKTLFSNSAHDLGTAGCGTSASHTGAPGGGGGGVTGCHSRTESPECRRFRLRFDLARFDPESVHVSVDQERIVVRASKIEESGIRREYGRKIERPRDLDGSKIKASLTADGILVVGATVQPQQSPSGRHARAACRRGHGGGSRGSSQSRSPVVGSPVRPGGGPPELKCGVPMFRDEIGGQRRLHLMVDIGPMFRSNDVTVQVIKDNRLMVRGRHEERTSEYVAKNKYSKEIDLPERIDSQSVRGGFSATGKLFVTALAKTSTFYAAGGAVSASHQSTAGMTNAGAAVASSSSSEPLPQGEGDGDEQLVPLDAEELLLADSHGVDLMPCNVLDLASFPPTVPATASGQLA